MRKVGTAVCLTAMAAFLFAAPLLRGQGNPTGVQGGHQGMDMGATGAPRRGGSAGMGPQTRTERLAAMLKLTDVQKSKLLDILTAEQRQVAELREQTTLAPAARRDKMVQIVEGAQSQVRAMLDPDQKQRFDEMMERVRQRRTQMDAATQGAGQAPAQGKGPGQGQGSSQPQDPGQKPK